MIPFPRRIELAFWSLLPGGITLLLLVVYAVPKHLHGFAAVMPLLHLMPVYYWGLLRAREMPYWFVFATGLLMDVASGLPLGASAFIYLLFFALLRSQRRHICKEGFLAKWGFFSALLLVTTAMQWLVLSIGAPAHDLGPPFMQWLLTICCYPVFHWLFDGLAYRMHARRWRVLHGR